jgi:hypothetical protein
MAILATTKKLTLTGDHIRTIMVNLPKESVIYHQIREKLIEAEDEEDILQEYGISRSEFIDNWLSP